MTVIYDIDYFGIREEFIINRQDQIQIYTNLTLPFKTFEIILSSDHFIRSEFNDSVLYTFFKEGEYKLKLKYFSGGERTFKIIVK